MPRHPRPENRQPRRPRPGIWPLHRPRPGSGHCANPGSGSGRRSTATCRSGRRDGWLLRCAAPVVGWLILCATERPASLHDAAVGGQRMQQQVAMATHLASFCPRSRPPEVPLLPEQQVHYGRGCRKVLCSTSRNMAAHAGTIEEVWRRCVGSRRRLLLIQVQRVWCGRAACEVRCGQPLQFDVWEASYYCTLSARRLLLWLYLDGCYYG